MSDNNTDKENNACSKCCHHNEELEKYLTKLMIIDKTPKYQIVQYTRGRCIFGKKMTNYSYCCDHSKCPQKQINTKVIKTFNYFNHVIDYCEDNPYRASDWTLRQFNKHIMEYDSSIIDDR
jgi:hypothetical protein